jgi:hypothetical protein
MERWLGQKTSVCSDVPLCNMLRKAASVQVVKEEGCYPGGRVHVELLPTEVYGPGCRRDFSLRRIDGGPLGEKDLNDHISKELLKVRCRCCITIL